MSETVFHNFFDDAAIFPPGLASLEAAVAEHIRRSRDKTADAFIGPLILTSDKVAEASRLAAGAALDISAVALADQLSEVEKIITRLAKTAPATRIEAVEVKAGEDLTTGIERAASFRADYGDIDVYVELPGHAVDTETLTKLKQYGLRLKFRTGGIEKRLFPSPNQVIEVVTAAVETNLPFKLTAGLHRAMGYTDPKTGFEHFGFLNIAAATAALHAGQDQSTALMLLNSDDVEQVTTALAESPKWRDSFQSFGTCSVIEPAETLREIGQLRPETVLAF